MAFSSRFPARPVVNALSRALAEHQAKGRDILDLTTSNPTRCGFTYPTEIIRQALASPEVMCYSPDPQGSLSAREAIARHHGRDLEPSELLLTASTSESYGLLFKLLADPGDEILIPTPSYPLFEWLARLEGVVPVPVGSWLHGRWNLDILGLEESCTPRTRAICVVNPNNPTGQFLSRQEWVDLTELCRRRDLALIVDEVFADFPLEPEPDHLPSALEMRDPPCPVFVLSGLSKAALLPQMKLGWIAARGPRATKSMEALAFLNDQYLNVGAPIQAAAPVILREAVTLRDQVRQRLLQNLRALDDALVAHPDCSRLPVGGGWSVLFRKPGVETDEAFALRLLVQEGVLVHPGHYFDLPGEGFLNLSLLVPPETFQKGVEHLSRCLKSR